MSAESNEKLARRWFEEGWNGRSPSVVTELFAADGVGWMEGPDGDVEIRGPEPFLAARAALLDAFPDLSVAIDGTVAQGDDVVVRWSAEGTHRGGGLGFDASGKRIAFRGMTWMRFRDGKVVRGWDSWNQGRLLATLQPRV
jgi:steroid delta-isomerase-like uncharacterized protein